MVKTPRTRHSRTKRSPVTIELDPGAISRVTDKPGDIPVSKENTAEDMSDTGASATAANQFSAEPSDNADSTDAADKSVGNDEDGPRDASTAFESEASSSENDDKARPGGARPEEAPRETATPARAVSRLPVFSAGIVGGVVALAAAGLLQYAGILGAPVKTDGSGQALGQVETEISTLKAEISALKDSPGAAPGVDPAKLDALSSALDQVRTDVASLQKTVESGGAGNSAGLEALGKRIDQIEAGIAGLSDTIPDATTPADIAAINERIAATEALAKAAGDSNSTLEGRLGAIDQRLDSLSAKVEAQAGQPKIALAIASAALKSAIERGVPFQSEIETFAAISPGSPDIAELRKYAEEGVATRAEIIAGTDAAANAMIAATAPPAQNAGFFDRLLTSAESLVTVRPIGAIEGQGVPETVARMEVAIQAGDFQQALAEYDSLPEPAQAAGAAFADKVRARMEVERLVDQTVAAAMKAE